MRCLFIEDLDGFQRTTQCSYSGVRTFFYFRMPAIGVLLIWACYYWRLHLDLLEIRMIMVVCCVVQSLGSVVISFIACCALLCLLYSVLRCFHCSVYHLNSSTALHPASNCTKRLVLFTLYLFVYLQNVFCVCVCVCVCLGSAQLVPVCVLSGHTASVYALAVSPDRRFLLSGLVHVCALY